MYMPYFTYEGETVSVQESLTEIQLVESITDGSIVTALRREIDVLGRILNDNEVHKYATQH